MTKTIVITSGKGGVGKTSISVNTAVELARRNYRTCLFDADFGLANVNILLGLHPEKNLDDFIFRGMALNKIIVSTEYGVDVIPGSSGVEKMANLDSAQLSSMVDAFGTLGGYDYFLIDTSSGISRGVISFCLAAPETILVLTAESTSLADAYAVLKVLSLNHYRGVVKILVNKCLSVDQAKKTYVHFKSVADKHLKIEVVPGGAVLADSNIEKSVMQQRPVSILFPDSMASQCIKALVANLIRTEPEDKEDDFSAFWSRYVDFVTSDLHLPDEINRHEERTPKQHESDGQSKNLNQMDSVKRSQSEPNESHAVLQGSSLVRDGLFTHLNLPSPVPLLGSVLEMQESGQLSIAEMHKIILYDPALIGKILHTHRPAQQVREERTISIKAAIAELGEKAVSKLLQTSATHGLLSEWSAAKYNAVNSLWAHSCRCGQMSAALAELIDYAFPEEAFLAGILHDIGRLALLTCYPAIYSSHQSVYSHDQKILAAEKNMAGRTHAELGADILAEWGLNSFIIDAARYHVETEERIATALDTTKLVYLADQLCSLSEEEMLSAVDLARTFFGLTASQVFTCMQIVGYDLARVADGYKIPRDIDIPASEVESILANFRQRALDYVTLYGVLQYPERGQVADILRLIHQGLGLLFGITNVICLLPNSGQTYLQASGYSHSFGGELLENIRFYLKSPVSKVVDAYKNGKVCMFKSSEGQPMADRQLLDVLQSDGMLCLPLVAAGKKRGIIVCGLHESELLHYKTLLKRFEIFAAQAAICVATQ